MKKADVFVAAYVLTAFIMFIVPLPNWLLDVFLAMNISVLKCNIKFFITIFIIFCYKSVPISNIIRILHIFNFNIISFIIVCYCNTPHMCISCLVLKTFTESVVLCSNYFESFFYFFLFLGYFFKFQTIYNK